MKAFFSVILISAVSTAVQPCCNCKHVVGNNASLDAIHALHRHLDDDQNGNVDLFESDEFLRQELHFEQGDPKRQENFHRNNDDQVSVIELWTMWVNSQVYNWTTDQTAEWVAHVVELPQYSEKFRQLKINGTHLPRLAVNHNNFLTARLGIKDFIVRQKLSLKAQDAVLFGPPKDYASSSRTKDMIFLALMVVTTLVSYGVYCRNVRQSKVMMKALQKSEASLKDLQIQLEQTNDELKVGFNPPLPPQKENDADEITRLQEEIKLVRNKLHRAEFELQLKRWIPPKELISWLQVTYDLEITEHKRKQLVAENLLKKASKACDKLRKRKSSFLYAFVSSASVDDVDAALLNARAALTKLTDEHRERMHRWNEIELLLNADTESTEAWSHESHESHSNTFIENVGSTGTKYQSWKKVKRLLISGYAS